MRISKMIIVTVMICTLMGAMVGCSEEGPAEKAGKKVDQAIEDAKDGAKKLFD